MARRPPPLPIAPTISVVIPARNAAATLEATVESVMSQTVSGELEVAIAVGPSTDDTLNVARVLAARDQRITVVDNPAGTTPAGLNAAIAATSGPIVARVDAHAILPPGYLARAADLLRATEAGNVGGMQVPVADRGFARAVAAAMRSPVGAGGATYRVGGAPGPVDTVYLGVFHRAALAEVGGFDETLERNQDYELNHRLREAGFDVFFHPDLAVAYQPRRTVQALWRQYHEYGAWKRVVLRRHPESLRLRQLAAPALVVGLLAALVVGILWSWWALAILTVAWLAALVAGAVLAADEPRDVVAVTEALAVMHLAWGLGFLRGVRGARSTRRSQPG